MTESSCGFHTAVNLAPSNRGIGVVAMNDIFEIWSLPWHALQRRLAKGVGAAVAAYATTNSRDAGGRVAAAAASNWLVRALSDSAPPAAFQTHR